MDFVPGGPQGHSSRLKFHTPGALFLRAEERGLSLEMNTPVFIPCPQVFVASGRSSDTRHLFQQVPPLAASFLAAKGLVGRDERSHGNLIAGGKHLGAFFGRGIVGRDDRSRSKTGR